MQDDGDDHGDDHGDNRHQQLFMDAVATGDIGTVRGLCWDGDVDVDPAANNSKAIHMAARRGHLAIVQFLCEMHLSNPWLGIDPAAKDNKAVYYAAREGHLPVVRYLCELGLRHPWLGISGFAWIESNLCDRTPLYAAACKGHLGVVQYLCELGCTLSIDTIPSFAAGFGVCISDAGRKGHLVIVQYLCELMLSRPLLRMNSLLWMNAALINAARFGHVDVVRYLCELAMSHPSLGMNPAARKNRAIGSATFEGHLSVVQYFCELALAQPSLGISPAAAFEEVVSWSPERAEVLVFLCEFGLAHPELGIDPTFNNYNAFHWASVNLTVNEELAPWCLAAIQCLCKHPAVDLFRVLQRLQEEYEGEDGPPAVVLEIVRAAQEQRRRWSTLRAAWVATAVAAVPDCKF
jgi:ankyrin repeat protein